MEQMRNLCTVSGEGMDLDSERLIQKLADAPGVSGFEDAVLSVAAGYAGTDFEITEDRVRNLFIRQKGDRQNLPRVMLDAHSDEVGFMIQSVNPSGTLRFQPLGGWNPQTVSAQAVRIRNDQGRWISGVVASRPTHFMGTEESKRAVAIDDLVIDVGAVSKTDLQNRFNIRIGAPVVPDVACRYDRENGLLYGKAFDDRLGCAVLLETMTRHAAGMAHLDVVGVLSSQEELGLRGVNVSVRHVMPDVAIVLEGTPADDTFGKETCIQAGIRRGPQIRHMDRSVLSNPRFVRFAVAVAEKHGIPFQEAVRSGGGNNAGVITLHDRGIPAITLGVPVRYIHTPHCIAAMDDYLDTVRWCAAILSELTRDVIEGF